MILVIDNYDSFTYNLVQYLGELGAEIVVKRNDEVTIDEIVNEINPDRIVISPGPGTPLDAGVSLEVIEKLSGKIPILGVCLGHQSIAHVFGADVVRAPEPIHGKPSDVSHDGSGIFNELQDPFEVGRYHSLVVEEESLPDMLRVTAKTKDGIVMGIEHTEDPTFGVQFHPESILTGSGKNLLRNFLTI